MATIAMIQVRLSSRRLPRKALADICGEPLIRHVARRVLATPGLDEVVLVCPPSDAADLGAAVAGLSVRLAPTQTVPVAYTPDGAVAAFDVLGACVAALPEKAKARDFILRVTGDCPLWCPEVGALVLDYQRHVVPSEGYYAFATAATTCSGWPDGLDAEAFTVSDLRWMDKQPVWPLDRQHVTRWLWRNRLAVVVLNPHGDWQDWPDLSVDTAEDLQRVREWVRVVGPDTSTAALVRAARQYADTTGR